MKKWLINFALLVLAIGIGIALFLMKQRVVEYEKELSALNTRILKDKREIHILKADWAVLTEPSRLRRLLAESELKQIKVQQIVSPAEVKLNPVPVPPHKPAWTEETEEKVEDTL